MDKGDLNGTIPNTEPFFVPTTYRTTNVCVTKNYRVLNHPLADGCCLLRVLLPAEMVINTQAIPGHPLVMPHRFHRVNASGTLWGIHQCEPCGLPTESGRCAGTGRTDPAGSLCFLQRGTRRLPEDGLNIARWCAVLQIISELVQSYFIVIW